MRVRRLQAATAVIAAVAGIGLAAGTADAAPTCSGAVQTHTELTATWTGQNGATLAKGGPVQESTAVFDNTTGHDVKNFRTSLYLSAADAPDQTTASAVTVQLRRPGGEWTAVNFGTGNNQNIIDTGTYQLAKGEKVTLQIRIGATGSAAPGHYEATESGGSDLLSDDTGEFVTMTPADNGAAPTTGPASPAAGSRTPAAAAPKGVIGTDTCTQFVGYTAAEFTVATPTPTTTPSTTPSKSPAVPVTATSPAASSTRPTRPASPGPTAATDELAATGANGTTALAVLGSATLAAGTAVLLVLRRRKGAHR
ncbi:LPXTG cell wall anchor domain-containing protein [Kitasatospora sp. NPDC048540]|uniref:LPXTG cell wall anchor domain-containing protein n=1 Tax=Kitasatospora sp. NPDC048540 TaxID=3155634 RepID=UPI0033DD8A76